MHAKIIIFFFIINPNAYMQFTLMLIKYIRAAYTLIFMYESKLTLIRHIKQAYVKFNIIDKNNVSRN